LQVCVSGSIAGPPATAKALREQFRAEGYRPGVPPGLDHATLALDLDCYRRIRCAR
jgi:hypothetical protein